MLEIKSVSWANFMSYGDSVTTVDIPSLGQCFITGMVLGDDEEYHTIDHAKHKRRNGAGKSTIANVILWVLFGKTMHSATPGDHVINWFTGKNCWGKVELKNGDYIVRTRATDGHNELLYVKDGQQEILTSTTVSIPKNQQVKLAKTFNLDYEIFCGSSFFAQYNQPWLEMADNTRKKAFERLLHVDRLTYYARVSKSKVESSDERVKRLRGELDLHTKELANLTRRIEAISNSISTYATTKAQRLTDLRANVERVLQNTPNKTTLPNIEAIKKDWAAITLVEGKLREERKKLIPVSESIVRAEQWVKSCTEIISNWKKKAGKTCVTCEQDIKSDHISSKIEPVEANLQGHQNSVNENTAKYQSMKAKFEAVEAAIEKKKPKITVLDAISANERYAEKVREHQRLLDQITHIENETSPYDEELLKAKSELDNLNKVIEQKNKLITTEELLNKHLSYIHRSYHDRTKIKSMVFRDRLPFLNERLRYYLDIFKLDIKISINDMLGVDSNLWSYKFESGGERKRTDVALMLSIYDFHEYMYGRQSNILVLDEVDGRLDDEGIESLVSVIKNDLAPKVETVLIISHRSNMRDTFDKEMYVVKKNNTSQLIL